MRNAAIFINKYLFKIPKINNLILNLFLFFVLKIVFLKVKNI